MFNEMNNFVPDRFSKESEHKFDLDEVVRNAQALREEFVHDLEEQRNIDPSNVLEAKEGVKEIFSGAMRKVKAQATQIQEEARTQGYEDGHEEGYQAGAEAVRERFDSSLEALEALVNELTELRKQSYPLLEREMVELVTTLARKVIHKELAGKTDGIREMIRLTVESVLDRETMIIKVNPEDYRELQDYGNELIQLFHDIKSVKFDAHASIPRGNCVVESNFGTVEAGLDHLDEHIERLLHLAPPAPPPPVPPPLEEPEAPQMQDDEGEPPGPVETMEPEEANGPVETDEWSKAIESTEVLEPVEPDEEEQPPVNTLEPGELPEPDEPMPPEAPMETDELPAVDALFEPGEPGELEESPEPDLTFGEEEVDDLEEPSETDGPDETPDAEDPESSV